MKFFKYQGTGNDFIIIDNRDASITLTQNQINYLCDRKFGIGADGLMLLENKEGYDFKMVYFNSDGKESTMCGNGGRCLVAFAHFLFNKPQKKYSFWAIDGNHEGIINENLVSLKMSDVLEYTLNNDHLIINTGSPHYVVSCSNLIQDDEFLHEAKKIRYSEPFHKHGININHIESISNNTLKIKTYERGVENITLSCGTGAIAGAIMHYLIKNKENKITVLTQGGTLIVELSKTDNGFNNIWLTGPAEYVFKGEINV